MQKLMRITHKFIFVLVLLAANFSTSAQAATAPIPSFSATTAREDGFSFKITNFSKLYTYSATTNMGYVEVGYHTSSFPSGSELYVIAYGLNKGESANVTVSASRTGDVTSSATISGTTVAAPSVTTCSPTSTISGSNTTLKFSATSESVDRYCDWTVPNGLTVISEAVLVGGGGGGGFFGNGGYGGAGAVLYKNNYAVTPGTTIRIIVGAGGAKAFQNSGAGPGNNGNNTIFDGIIAAGGGGGAGGDSSSSPRFCNGFKGGSGGGANDDGCSTSGGSSIAAAVCGCSGVWTIYANDSGNVRKGGGAAASGVSTTLLGVSLGASGGSIPSSGNGGGTNITGSSGVVLLKFGTPVPVASVLIAAISGSIYKGRVSQIVANLSHPGKVRFLANGKRIAGCLSVATTGTSPITATCNWKPTVSSPQRITATLTPTDSALAPASTEILTSAIKRLNNR